MARRKKQAAARRLGGKIAEWLGLWTVRLLLIAKAAFGAYLLNLGETDQNWIIAGGGVLMMVSAGLMFP